MPRQSRLPDCPAALIKLDTAVRPRTLPCPMPCLPLVSEWPASIPKIRICHGAQLLAITILVFQWCNWALLPACQEAHRPPVAFIVQPQHDGFLGKTRMVPLGASFPPKWNALKPWSFPWLLGHHFALPWRRLVTRIKPPGAPRLTETGPLEVGAAAWEEEEEGLPLAMAPPPNPRLPTHCQKRLLPSQIQASSQPIGYASALLLLRKACTWPIGAPLTLNRLLKHRFPITDPPPITPLWRATTDLGVVEAPVWMRLYQLLLLRQLAPLITSRTQISTEISTFIPSHSYYSQYPPQIWNHPWYRAATKAVCHNLFSDCQPTTWQNQR